MSDFDNDNLTRESLDFDTNTILADAGDKQFYSADELAAQQEAELAAQPEEELAVQQQGELAAQQQDVLAAQQNDKVAGMADDTSKRNDLAVRLDIIGKEIAICGVETYVEVVDSNVADNDPEVASESDFKAVTYDITNVENTYFGQKTEVTESISVMKTNLEVFDSDSKSQFKTYYTLLESDDMDIAKVLEQDTIEEVTRKVDFNVEESDANIKKKYESCVKEGFEVDSADDFNDKVASSGKNVDCSVKDSTGSKTSSATTKKGKVSFKIHSSDDANKLEEASTSQETNPRKARLTPKMLDRMKTLLLQKSHYSSKDGLYIGDIIGAVEGELMNIPKKRKRRSSKREERIKHLTKNKVRSINIQRRNICLNMQVLSSSLNTEFENLDETLLNLRQASSDFNAEFNQPHTPIGEPKAASLGMEELFLKIKTNLPILQDCFKEVKHCSRLYIKADMTLTDNLYNTIQTYFGDRLKGKHIPRVRYSEVLKTFMKSNRQHCQLDLDANAMDKTSDTSLDHDTI